MTPTPHSDQEPGPQPQPAAPASDLANLQSELARLQQEFDGFTYAVAHDLRAPLRAVTGFLQAITDDYFGHLPAPAQAYFQRAIDSSSRAQRMLEALLRLSRLGRQPLARAATPLAEIVAAARQEIMREAAGREVEWRIGELPVLACDGRLVHEALGHLLRNAVKFTRRQPHAIIEVFADPATIPPVIAVRDNGVGFNAARAEHLGMPFARFHGQQDFEGLGVGLAITDKIVRKHGGRLWVESAEGQGATVRFTLEAGSEPGR
jgi:light-regulated signal transduction histidine kinase (bacteriophytochrome)